MKKKNKKILKGVLLGMACALATGLVLQVTNVFDLFTEETPTEEHSEEVKLGTPVPIEGSIDSLYFNTNLSIEEIVNILKTLPYSTNEQGYEMYNIFQANLVGTNLGFSYDVGKFGNIYGFMATTINDNGIVSQTVIFVSEQQEVISSDFVGWNPTFLNNGNANTLDGGILNIVSGGTSNDLISNVISITPFESEVN